VDLLTFEGKMLFTEPEVRSEYHFFFKSQIFSTVDACPQDMT
jgi:hypothetical protein